MASNDLLKRLMDAGVSFTQMTQSRAEQVVKELVNLGEVGVDEARDTVAKLVDKGRESTEHLVELVRSEVTRQLQALGIVGAPSAPSAPAASTAPSEPAPAPAAETPAAAAKKAAAKKAAAKKAPAKKAPAKKAPAKKAAAKEAPAKKAATTGRPSEKLGR